MPVLQYNVNIYNTKTLRSPIGGDIQVKNRMDGLLHIVKVNNERQHFNTVKFLLDGKPTDIT